METQNKMIDSEGREYVRYVSKEFTYHKLNDEGLLKAKQIAEAFDDLLLRLNVICTEGREFSIVKTKLEEACFFAKKSMATSPSNQLGQ